MSKRRGSRGARPHPAQRLRPWLVLFGGAGVLGLAVFLFAQPYQPPASAAAEAQVVRISMGGWQPGDIEAKAGEEVTVTVVNLDNQFHTDGGGWHNFVLPDLGLDFRVSPKATDTFTFTASVPPGEYLFYCDICCGGKDNPFMQGTLSVT